jgi:hypothetical protein
VSACPPMTGLSITNITSNSAGVTWNTLPCATKYRPSYRKVTTTTAIWIYSELNHPAAGTSLTGLLPNTQYGVRVRSVCTGNLAGALTAEKKFKTTATGAAPTMWAGNGINPNASTKVEPNVAVYPNPSNGHFNLDVSDMPDQAVSLIITDNTGANVMAWRTNVQSSRLFEPFDLSDLPTGLYVLRLKLDDGSTIVRTIIKN